MYERIHLINIFCCFCFLDVLANFPFIDIASTVQWGARGPKWGTICLPKHVQHKQSLHGKIQWLREHVVQALVAQWVAWTRTATSPSRPSSRACGPRWASAPCPCDTAWRGCPPRWRPPARCRPSAAPPCTWSPGWSPLLQRHEVGRVRKKRQMWWQGWPKGSEEPHRAPHTHTHAHTRDTTWILKVVGGGSREGGRGEGGLAGNYGWTTDEAVTHASSTQTQRHDVIVDMGSLKNMLLF